MSLNLNPRERCAVNAHGRTLFLYGDIDTDLIQKTVQKLLELGQDSSDPILLIVNSPGGNVRCMNALLDAIRMTTAPVNVLVLGQACSAAAILTILAEPGRRFVSPTSTLMVHPISSYSRGNSTEMREELRRITRLELDQRKEILERTRLSRSELNKLMRTEKLIRAGEALNYGMVDKIVTRFDQIPMGKKSRKGHAL